MAGNPSVHVHRSGLGQLQPRALHQEVIRRYFRSLPRVRRQCTWLIKLPVPDPTSATHIWTETYFWASNSRPCERYRLTGRRTHINVLNLKNDVERREICSNLILLRIAQQLAQNKIYIRSFPGVVILQIALKCGPTTLKYHNSTTMSMWTTRMYVWGTMFIEWMVI